MRKNFIFSDVRSEVALETFVILSTVLFPPYSLIGTSPLRCLPSGRWSSPTPACLSVVCPESILSLASGALRVEALAGFGVGDRVAFSCATGFELAGPKEAHCRADGKW